MVLRFWKYFHKISRTKKPWNRHQNHHFMSLSSLLTDIFLLKSHFSTYCQQTKLQGQLYPPKNHFWQKPKKEPSAQIVCGMWIWTGKFDFFKCWEWHTLMGDNYKILSSAMGFSYIKKIVFMVRGCTMGPGGLFGSL